MSGMCRVQTRIEEKIAQYNDGLLLKAEALIAIELIVKEELVAHRGCLHRAIKSDSNELELITQYENGNCTLK